MIVVWLFLEVPWVCLQFVIVTFPDHTHLLFFIFSKIYFCKDFFMTTIGVSNRLDPEQALSGPKLFAKVVSR